MNNLNLVLPEIFISLSVMFLLILGIRMVFRTLESLGKYYRLYEDLTGRDELVKR